MNTPTWAKLIANMDRLGYSLAELRYRGSVTFPARIEWHAQFCRKDQKANGFLDGCADEPLGALTMAAMKMLEARANAHKHRADSLAVKLRGKAAEVEQAADQKEPEFWRANTGALLWQEDDATVHDPDHERLPQAFKRLTGNPWSYEVEKPWKTRHAGDGTWYLFNDVVVLASYPGNLCIWRRAE